MERWREERLVYAHRLRGDVQLSANFLIGESLYL
jgi:hypothetical protein